MHVETHEDEEGDTVYTLVCHPVELGVLIAIVAILPIWTLMR